jgi:hypothetical protein
MNATSSQLDHPTRVIIDINDNVFIADCKNQRIRKVSVSGKFYIKFFFFKFLYLIFLIFLFM